LKSIFKEAHGAFEPIPEHARMRELIDKATDSAPKPPNIHQIRVDVRLLEGLKSDPSLMKNRVDWLVKRAVAQARSRS